MQATIGPTGAMLIREDGDKPIRRETAIATAFARLLNANGFHFVRFNPSKHGLTDCRIGVIDRAAKIILWHERYQIEDCAEAYNAGAAFLRREAL